MSTMASPVERKQRAKQLAAAGFVHVSGLKAHYSLHPAEDYVILAEDNELGHWDHNNGYTVVVTNDGEVWLRVGLPDDPTIIRKIAPRRGAFVPCSSGEGISAHHLLMRVADPYSKC